MTVISEKAFGITLDAFQKLEMLATKKTVLKCYAVSIVIYSSDARQTSRMSHEPTVIWFYIRIP